MRVEKQCQASSVCYASAFVCYLSILNVQRTSESFFTEPIGYLIFPEVVYLFEDEHITAVSRDSKKSDRATVKVKSVKENQGVEKIQPEVSGRFRAVILPLMKVAIYRIPYRHKCRRESSN